MAKQVNKFKRTILNMYKKTLHFCLLFIAILSAVRTTAQIGMPGANKGSRSPLSQVSATAEADKPKEFEIGGITVSGAKYLDEDLLLAVTGLSVGQKVRLPNDENIAKAIRALWKQELFSNASITITKFIDNKVFLNVSVEERPRLSKYNFKGIKPGEAKEVKEKLTLVKERVVTEATKKEAVVRIIKFFNDKGYGRCKVTVTEKPDTLAVNKIILTFNIDKGYKTHINQVNITGNEHASEARLKKTLKSTKEMMRLTLHPFHDNSVYGSSKRSFAKYVKNFGFLSLSKTLDAMDPYFRFKLFSSSKYNQQKFEDDKQALVAYYNTLGYRDAAVVADTEYAVENGNLNIDMKVKEGQQYYFGDITWKGNTKYSDEQLTRVLGIKKGDISKEDKKGASLRERLETSKGIKNKEISRFDTALVGIEDPHLRGIFEKSRQTKIGDLDAKMQKIGGDIEKTEQNKNKYKSEIETFKNNVGDIEKGFSDKVDSKINRIKESFGYQEKLDDRSKIVEGISGLEQKIPGQEQMIGQYKQALEHKELLDKKDRKEIKAKLKEYEAELKKTKDFLEKMEKAKAKLDKYIGKVENKVQSWEDFKSKYVGHSTTGLEQGESPTTSNKEDYQKQQFEERVAGLNNFVGHGETVENLDGSVGFEITTDPVANFLKERGFTGDAKLDYSVDVMAAPGSTDVRALHFNDFKGVKSFIENSSDRVVIKSGVAPYKITYKGDVQRWVESLSPEDKQKMNEAWDKLGEEIVIEPKKVEKKTETNNKETFEYSPDKAADILTEAFSEIYSDPKMREEALERLLKNYTEGKEKAKIEHPGKEDFVYEAIASKQLAEQLSQEERAVLGRVMDEKINLKNPGGFEVALTEEVVLGDFVKILEKNK